MLKKIKKVFKTHYAVFLIAKSRWFNSKWYANQVGHNLAPWTTPAEHYYHKGWKLHNPSLHFDGLNYLQENPDVAEAGICPLYHYERYGKHEGRNGPKDMGTYRMLSAWRALKRVCGKLQSKEWIEQNQKARILVCFQLFYPKSWPEIKEYFKNLAPYSFDFIITYQDEEAMLPVLKDIRRFHPSVILLPVENVGFDIGGFWTALQNVDLNAYDIVFKLHSKGTSRKRLYIYHRFFKRRDWFLYLFEGVLGAKTVHATIHRLMHDSTCGLVAASNLLVQDPPHKQRLLAASMRDYPDIKIPKDYTYVAGTCFAIRAKHLKWFQEQAFDFPESQRGQFSLAHGVERVLSLLPVFSGEKLVGNDVCFMRQKIRDRQSRSYQTNQMEVLLSDDRFDLDDEFIYRKLESLRITDYELTKVRLGDIKRVWFDGSVLSLAECAPYLYLNGDIATYDDYCRYHAEHNLYPMSRERFDALIQSIEIEGFDPRKVIVLGQDNTLMDGQHRLCCLLKRYGEDFEVPAVRMTVIARWTKM